MHVADPLFGFRGIGIGHECQASCEDLLIVTSLLSLSPMSFYLDHVKDRVVPAFVI